ncbi:MAG: hypothetical protein KGQ66_04865 [Acidobacteriota bacterium]|nr:hypothetical protein [Acidobacteriota bacterium]
MTGHGNDGRRPDDILAELARWSATERVGRAARERTRLRSLLEQSATEATLSGLLVDLAESGAEATLSVRGGGRYTGRLSGVGRDLVALDRAGRGPVLVPVDALGTVTPADAGAATWQPSGRRHPPLELTLAGALDVLAAEAAPVTVHVGEERISGTVASCGEDLLTVRTGTDPHRPVHVALAAVTGIELR